MYDEACETLAKHFLTDGGTKEAPDQLILAALAQHIQTEIEVWLEYELPTLQTTQPEPST